VALQTVWQIDFPRRENCFSEQSLSGVLFKEAGEMKRFVSAPIFRGWQKQKAKIFGYLV